jgi:hypothetical protein
VVDFDKLLQQSLLGVNKAFEQADADLHEMVAAAAEALGRVANGVVELKLRKVSEDRAGVVYELVVGAVPDFGRGVGEGVAAGAYQVAAKGYPIRAGNAEVDYGRLISFRSQSSFNDKADLQRHFEELMANPDSPVVTTAAFLMRKATSSPPTR